MNEEFASIKLTDLRRIATLGVGGFGRVELVQIAGDSSRSFALKQMKKSQVQRYLVSFIDHSFGNGKQLEMNLISGLMKEMFLSCLSCSLPFSLHEVASK